ncbi:MAG: MotA/TolQ/ExbB proton channel family protein [Gammaproteobacteria bacterium]
MDKQDHHLFLNWLILTGAIFFCVVVAWHQGLFHSLFASDKSKISIAICLIYSLGTLHCAFRSWIISKQLMLADRASSLIEKNKDKPVTFGDDNQQNISLRLADQTTLPDSILTDFLGDTIKASKASDENKDKNSNSALAEIYSDKLKASHDYGWFFVDAMIKLGLLGTIVGFIFMLGSVADSSNLDLNAMQKVMQQMSSGMGTALYTTLAGLVGSLLLAMQYQLIDRGADDLMHTAVHTAEVNILPNLGQNHNQEMSH